MAAPARQPTFCDKFPWGHLAPFFPWKEFIRFGLNFSEPHGCDEYWQARGCKDASDAVRRLHYGCVSCGCKLAFGSKKGRRCVKCWEELPADYQDVDKFEALNHFGVDSGDLFSMADEMHDAEHDETHPFNLWNTPYDVFQVIEMGKSYVAMHPKLMPRMERRVINLLKREDRLLRFVAKVPELPEGVTAPLLLSMQACQTYMNNGKGSSEKHVATAIEEAVDHLACEHRIDELVALGFVRTNLPPETRAFVKRGKGTAKAAHRAYTDRLQREQWAKEKELDLCELHVRKYVYFNTGTAQEVLDMDKGIYKRREELYRVMIEFDLSCQWFERNRYKVRGFVNGEPSTSTARQLVLRIMHLPWIARNTRFCDLYHNYGKRVWEAMHPGEPFDEEQATDLIMDHALQIWCRRHPRAHSNFDFSEWLQFRIMEERMAQSQRRELADGRMVTHFKFLAQKEDTPRRSLRNRPCGYSGNESKCCGGYPAAVDCNQGLCELCCAGKCRGHRK